MAELIRLRKRIIDLEARKTGSKKTRESARASESRYRRLFESAGDGIAFIDADTGVITDVNPSLAAILGLSREDLVGKLLWQLDPFKIVHASMTFQAELLSQGHVRHEDLPFESKDGRHIDLEFVGNVYRIDGKRVIQCNIRDVTGRRKAEEELKYLSTHDGLTGLHNRMFFDEELSRFGRGRQFPITVIIADVDGLKQINDRLGHADGDEMLRRAASVLKETFRADEIVARTGGDEFVVILPKTDGATAQIALDRIRHRLNSHNAAQAGLALSFSLGAATATAAQSLAEALKRADEHMYVEKLAHKLKGRDFAPRDLQLIFKRIDARLSESPGIHISQLAAELACERHVIERAVKMAKSMPFREYQQVRRMETALHLLAEKPLLIKEIAGALGYTSPTSLWRLFKTRMKKSPSRIRVLKSRIAAADAGNAGALSTPENAEQLKLNFPTTAAG